MNVAEIKYQIEELPTELQEMIYEKTMELRLPRKVLEPIQSLDIQTYTMFNQIISVLKNNPNTQYYLNWLETSILFELNDQRALFEELSPSMYNAFKGLNDDEIISEIENEHLSEKGHINTLKHYWKHLSPGKRNRLYTMYTRHGQMNSL